MAAILGNGGVNLYVNMCLLCFCQLLLLLLFCACLAFSCFTMISPAFLALLFPCFSVLLCVSCFSVLVLLFLAFH